MNYRHAYHAGNFADVVKHVALVAILKHLRMKDTAFAVIDTHAGRGLYDLTSEEATRTGEAQAGIGRILDAPAAAPGALATYLDLVRTEGKARYPGSPLIAARLLRDRDRLVAIEKHPEEVAALAETLASFRGVKVVRGDGYHLLPGMLPLPERRGLVLIDPPFESESEFHDCARVLGGAHRRFPSGIYLAWFPRKSAGAGDLFCDELLAGGASRLVRVGIDVSAERKAGGQLAAAGLALVNPPFGFVEEMHSCAAVLAPLLGEERPAKFAIETLARG